MWLALMHALLGTWPTTQACALTGNRASDTLVHRPALNPRSYTSQGLICSFKKDFIDLFLLYVSEFIVPKLVKEFPYTL